MNKLILLLLLIPSLLLAETDPYLAQKGHVLPQDSWVFSIDKTKEIRNKLIDLETEQKLNESYKKSLTSMQDLYTIEQSKTKILLEHTDSLAKSLSSAQSMSNVERFAWFALGTISTILVFKAVNK